MTTDAQMPELIWLIPGAGNDGETVWCDDPSPGAGMEPDDAVEYRRADLCASGQVLALTRAAGDESKAGWIISFDDLQAIRAAAGDWGYSLDLEAVEALALEVERRILAALTPAPQATCRKCGGTMQPGIAMGQTFTAGIPDDLGGDVQTMSAGGPGALIDCMKCSACGWSVTAGQSTDYYDQCACGTAKQCDVHPQPAGEAVPEAWQCKDFAEGWVTYSKQYESHVRKYHEQTGCIIRPLYAHPPQPSVSVAEAGMAALKELANTQMNISLTDWQRISSTIAAALRALKGGE